MSSALKSEKDRDILFRVHSPVAAWRSLVDTYSSKTHGASLALLHNLNSVRIEANDDPTLKLLKMEDIARSLRSSHSQWHRLTESYGIGKFVNALPREYDIQKQMLEERDDGFSREAVVSSVQKRFESSTYKKLHHSNPKSAEDQAFVVTGGGKNQPGRGGSCHGSGKPGGSQGSRGKSGCGGSGGGSFSGGGASSGGGSGNRREGPPHRQVLKDGEHGDAVDMPGRTSTNDDSPVRSEAELEAYTTLEIKTCECLVSMMEEGAIRRIGDDLKLLGTEATGHFTYDPRSLEKYAECSRVLRCAGGNTFTIVGTSTLRLSLRPGEGMFCVTSMDVAQVPGLSRHLLSLGRITDAGNRYIGTLEGIRVVFATPGDELFAPSYGQLNGLSGYRTDTSSEEKHMP